MFFKKILSLKGGLVIVFLITLNLTLILKNQKVEALTVTSDCPDCALWGIPQVTGPYYKEEGGKCYKYYERTTPCSKTKNGTPTNCERVETDYNKTEVGCEGWCTSCQTAACGQISAVGIKRDAGLNWWSGYKCVCEEPLGGTNSTHYASCKGEPDGGWVWGTPPTNWFNSLYYCQEGQCKATTYYDSGSCGVGPSASCQVLPLAWGTTDTKPACACNEFCEKSTNCGDLGYNCCPTGCNSGLVCCNVMGTKKCLNSCATWECNPSNYTCSYNDKGVTIDRVKQGYGFGNKSSCEDACKPPLTVSCTVDPASGPNTTSFNFKVLVSGGSGTYYCSITSPVDKSSSPCSNNSTIVTKTFTGFTEGDYSAILNVKDSYGREQSANCEWKITSAAKPDLKITEFGYDQTQGRFYYKEKNIGQGNAGPHYVGVFEKDGRQSISGKSISSLDSGQETNTLYSNWSCPNNTSVYTFYAFADSGEVIEESDETNNKTGYLTIDCRPPAQPDLIISSLSTSPSSGSPNSSVTIKIKEKNQGSADASSHYIYLYIDGSYTTNFNISSLSANSETSEQTYNYTCPSSGGSYTIRAVADGGGNIAESDETNNEKSLTLDCGTPSSKPDLYISNISISPSNPAINQSVTIKVTEGNKGSATAGSHYVELFVNNQSKGTKNVSSLGSNQTVDLTWDNIYTCSSCSSVSVKATADSSSQIDESDESNNNYQTSFSCGQNGSVDLYSNTTNVSPGGSVTLYWAPSNIQSGTCNASASPSNSSWSGYKSDSNTYPGVTISNLQQTTTFTLTCTDQCNNSVSDSVTVTVSDRYSCNSSSGCVQDPSGSYTSLSDCQNVCKKRCSSVNQCSTTYSTNTSLPACSNNSDCKKCTSSGTCSTSGTGNWCTSDSQCTVRYSCNSSSGCVQDPSGSYTSSNCNGVCIKRCTNAGQCTYSDNTSLSSCSNNSDCKKCTSSGTCSTSGTGNWCTSDSQCQQNPCRIDYFYPSSYSVSEGGTTTLYWSTSNCTSCTASSNPTNNNWKGTIGTSGSKETSSINSDTTFTLSCSGNGASPSQTVTVSVTKEVSVKLNCGSEPDECYVPYISGANLNWQISNATCYEKSDSAYWGDNNDPWYVDYKRTQFTSNQLVRPVNGGEFYIAASHEVGSPQPNSDCCTSVDCDSYGNDNVYVYVIPPPQAYLYPQISCVTNSDPINGEGIIFYNASATFDLYVRIEYDEGETTTCTLFSNSNLIGSYSTKGVTGDVYLGSKTVSNLKTTTTFKMTCSNSKYGSSFATFRVTVLPQGTEKYKCDSSQGCVLDACGNYDKQTCANSCKQKCLYAGHCAYTDNSYYKDRPDCTSNDQCHPNTYKCYSNWGRAYCEESYEGTITKEECESKCKARCVGIGQCRVTTDDQYTRECNTWSDCGKCYNGRCSYSSGISSDTWCSKDADCQKYKCVTDTDPWDCKVNSSGPYSSYDECRTNCVKPPEPCKIEKFTINNQSPFARLLLNTTSTLEWNTSNCDNCDLDCKPSGCVLENRNKIGTSGTIRFMITSLPQTSYTYTLKCENNTATYQGNPYPTSDTKTIQVSVYEYSWWREIIPQLQPFLRGLFRF